LFNLNYSAKVIGYIMDKEEALEHVKKALLLSYKAVMQTKNKSREMKTLVDIKTLGDEAATKALISYFKSSKLPVVLYTEELEKPIKLSPRPALAIIGDDIDGTYNFKYGRGLLPHGSILGIFSRPDPKFSDCIACGFLEFNSGNLFYAVKGRGAYMIEKWASGGTKAVRIKTSGKTRLYPDLGFIGDLYMLGDLTKDLVPYVVKRGGDFMANSVHMTMAATGYCDILVVGDNCPNPNKRKTGEELGPGYLLIKEAGGVVLDWNGKDLGNEKISLDKGKAFHVVVGATNSISTEFIGRMKKLPGIASYMKKKKL
jgi:fructose-1,6-bisphosphatase/inositol monophosphatase family enzyme